MQEWGSYISSQFLLGDYASKVAKGTQVEVAAGQSVAALTSSDVVAGQNLIPGL